MNDDPYVRLARHLDSLPGGFPRTQSGVEMRILRRLFSPDEAQFAVHLSLIPEEAGTIAVRAGVSKEEASMRLEEMASKGLFYRIVPRNREPLYMASQYVIGIWEYHVNDLDPDLIRDMNEYIPTLFDMDVWKKAPQLRTVPVGRSIEVRQEIMQYEDAGELVKAQKKILVAPCICRRERKIAGEGCDRPEETCLVFNTAADYYKRNGLGRFIDVDAALEILENADRAGLVLQPSNARKIVNICCCCGCCCQVLRNVKRHPRPAELVSSPFVAGVDHEACSGCGICVERCQMDALRMEEKVVLDRDRCIGCGLCVSTCPTGALSLERKPDSEQPRVPRNMVESTIRLGRARGRMGSIELAKMQLRSKMDRLRAVRSTQS